MTPDSRATAGLRRRLLLLLAALPVAACANAATATPTITVYAAASLAGVLQRVADQYAASGAPPVKLSFASSAVLARQIAAGAAADVFIPADEDWMDYLSQRGLIRTASRVALVGNRLVLVAPVDSKTVLQIAPGFALAAALGNARLALADPDSVPAGRYARAALTRLGAWDSVAARLARAEDVRGALAFVARGEAPLGIVYQTDARAEPRVREVALFPADTHPPIVYPLAQTTHASPAAAQFVAFLRGPQAAVEFARAGFIVLR